MTIDTLPMFACPKCGSADVHLLHDIDAADSRSGFGIYTCANSECGHEWLTKWQMLVPSAPEPAYNNAYRDLGIPLPKHRRKQPKRQKKRPGELNKPGKPHFDIRPFVRRS